MSRRRILGVAILLAFACMAPKEGCTTAMPQKIDVSPDGKTLYFSASPFTGGTTAFALDVESGRLRALTQSPGQKEWFTASPDGSNLYYMRNADSNWITEALDLKTGAVVPISGATSSLRLPVVLPGSEPRLLLFEGQWQVYGSNYAPMTIPMLPEHPWGAEEPSMPAVATNRFAVAGLLEEPKDDKPEKLGFFVVDIVTKEVPAEKEGEAPHQVTETPVTPLAPLDVANDDRLDRLDLAFTSDGKRLAMSIMRHKGEVGSAEMYELDLTGKAPPKLLFKDLTVEQPQWTSNGAALVYQRECKRPGTWSEIVVRKLDGSEPTVLARVPGRLSCRRWNEDGSLTIYNVSDDGVRVITADADGWRTKAKMLSFDKVTAQAYLAQIEFSLNAAKALMPGNPPANADAPEDPKDAELLKTMKPIHELMEARDRDVRAGVETAWKKWCAWEETQAKPDPGKIILDALSRELDVAKKMQQDDKAAAARGDKTLSDPDKKALEGRIQQLEDDIEDVKQAVAAGAK